MCKHTVYHAYREILKIFNSDFTWIIITILVISFCIFIARQHRKTKENKKQEAPETWKYKFKYAHGVNQSPINLEMDMASIMENCYSLRFSEHYFSTPRSMTIYNNGFGILIRGCFQLCSPFLYGGPLNNNKYHFNIAGFKWGPNDFEGSEHTINFERYAMELQVMHIKWDKQYTTAEAAANDQALLFISYFFQITPEDNPYLTTIVSALDKVKQPHTDYSILPIPLCWIFPPFKTEYYYYEGSLTYPPCTEGVDWIIQPEPLGISSNQLQEFRKLLGSDGPMMRNTRNVQNINDREIYYFS